jgi:epoxyqueuosine reductase
MPPVQLTAALKAEARRLGFDLVGAAPAVEPPGWERYRDWVAAGRAGEMGYLADRVDQRRHPRSILAEVRGVLMLAANYHTVEPATADQIGAGQNGADQDGVDQDGADQDGAGQGGACVSRYAWGRDYHDTLRERLRRLADFHRELTPAARVRGVVDTAPLLERDYARLAGLGWIGKNTCLINRRFGSWLFLAAMLTSEELDYDRPYAADHCGRCRRCLDACPTGALVAPYTLDARRCLSYATIELRGPIPDQLKPALGNRLLGCDTCQAVCPHNRCTPCSTEADFQPRPGMNPVQLAAIESLTAEDFKLRFADTPLARPGVEGLLRNAAAIHENQQ